MIKVECLAPAYDRIRESGIAEKILEKKRKLWEIIICSDLYPDEDIIKKAEEKINNPDSEKQGLYKDLLALKDYLDKMIDECGFISLGREREILIEHPSYIAYAVLGEGILNFEKYGFDSRKQLEESVTSFCLGEKHLFMTDMNEYYWRNHTYKNHLSNSTHGDISVSQTDVSGKRTMPENDFPVWENVLETGTCNGFGGGFEQWKPFLTLTLDYARAIGKEDIPEIANWREILKNTRIAGDCTAEAFEIKSKKELQEILELVRLNCILNPEEKELHDLPYMLGGKKSFLPYLENGRLVYIQENAEGDIELPWKVPIFKGKRYSRMIEYSPEDLPDLMKGIYVLFGRDRKILPVIMEDFAG